MSTKLNLQSCCRLISSATIASGKGFYLSDLAKKIVQISGRKIPVVFAKSGLNRDYTGRNNRIKSLIQDFKFSDIEDSLAKVYDYYLEHKELIDINNIDARWK